MVYVIVCFQFTNNFTYPNKLRISVMQFRYLKHGHFTDGDLTSGSRLPTGSRITSSLVPHHRGPSSSVSMIVHPPTSTGRRSPNPGQRPGPSNMNVDEFGAPRAAGEEVRQVHRLENFLYRSTNDIVVPSPPTSGSSQSSPVRLSIQMVIKTLCQLNIFDDTDATACHVVEQHGSEP